MINSYKMLKVKEGLLEDAYEDAQNKVLAYYYVKRFKKGIVDWDFMNGGEAKVIPLGNLESVKGNKYKFNYNGKEKKIKIPYHYGVK